MASAFGDPLAPSPCEQCENATEGTMRCSVRDNKNLCQDCFQGLPQARREDIGDPEWVCKIHSDSKVDIFCETCQLGCCKECAVDVHQGHNVVNVLKLLEEIRRDLTEQLKEVSVRAERLSELRRKIESTLGKIEEAPKLVHKVFDEIKEEVAQNLEKEVYDIQLKAQSMIPQVRDYMLNLAKEKANHDNQKIEEIQRGISTPLLEDAEKRIYKLQKAESKLMVGQRACESANLEIKSLLESTPEKLACRGRQLGSLVNSSSAFQCQDDVLDCCREVKADLPKLKVEKDNFFNKTRPLSPLVKFVLCIHVVYWLSPESFRDEYNRFFSSESMTSMIRLLCLYVYVCIILTIVLVDITAYYPIIRRESFIKSPKSCILIARLGLQFWVLTVFFLILVLNRLQVKSMSEISVSMVTTLWCCCYVYDKGQSKTFKDFWDYQKLYKI